MITTLSDVNPRHDYSDEECYLVFYHNDKPTSTKEIKADWFDINYGDKVKWLLVREYNSEEKEPRYRNIKLENIDKTVKVEQKRIIKYKEVKKIEKK